MAKPFLYLHFLNYIKLMVNTEKIESDEQNKLDYPYIGKSKYSGQIVLFTSEETGFTVFNETSKSYNPIGYYSENWCERDFEIFNGKIKLKNN